jgi:hypothetical protein
MSGGGRVDEKIRMGAVRVHKEEDFFRTIFSGGPHIFPPGKI